MKSRKNKKIKICVYCEQPAECKDHIPSKNLFNPKNRNKAKFTKVWSCKKCNGGFSKDEEFFRNLFVTVAQDYSEKAFELFYSKVKRSIEKRPALGGILLRNMSLADVITPSGIFLGTKTVIEVPKEDRIRIFNVMDKYVKGLASSHLGCPIPKGYIIRHIWADQNDQTFESENFLWNTDNFSTFIYGFAWIPNTFISILLSIFFKKIFFKSFVLEENSPQAKKIPENCFTVRPDPFN